MIGFLWPPALDVSEPGFGVRLGRLSHWIFAGLGWLFVAVAILNLRAETAYTPWTCAILAAFAFLAGRGIRYLLAAE